MGSHDYKFIICFLQSFSLVPKLPWDSTPAQLQCSCSRAWEPGNEANNCLLLVSPDLVIVQIILLTKELEVNRKIYPAVNSNTMYSGSSRFKRIQLPETNVTTTCLVTAVMFLSVYGNYTSGARVQDTVSLFSS